MTQQLGFAWVPPEPRIGPALSYYGSKWQVASRYPRPQHSTLIEPFAGGAGYALCWWDRDVRLFDVDEVVVGIWDYLIRVSASEILELPLWSSEFDTIDDLPVCQEARWLISFWFGWGNAYPLTKPGRRMRAGESPGKYWGERRRERVARVAEQISHWSVELASWEDIDASIEATWFVDPPYSVAGKYYRHSVVDYEALGSWCMRLPGQALVCENRGATWLDFEEFATINSSNHKGSKEVLWESAGQDRLGASSKASRTSKSLRHSSGWARVGACTMRKLGSIGSIVVSSN